MAKEQKKLDASMVLAIESHEGRIKEIIRQLDCTRIDAEMKLASTLHSERMSKLRAAAAAEEAKLNAEIVALLKAEDADRYEQLATKARVKIDVEAEKRSRRAKAARAKTEEPAARLEHGNTVSAPTQQFAHQ